MTKYLLALLLSFSFSFVKSQESTTDQNSNDNHSKIDSSKFAVGIVGAYEFNRYDYPGSWREDNYNNKSLPGFSTGAMIKYRFYDKYFIHGGILYAQQGNSYKTNTQLFDDEYPANSDLNRVEVVRSYIRIPVQIGAKFPINHWISFLPQLGVSTQYEYASTQKFIYDNHIEQHKSYEVSDSFQFIGHLDLGFSFNILESTQVYVAPFVGHALNAVSEMESGQFTLGGRVGIYYNF